MFSLNNKKFFFLLKLKFNFLNYNYLCFIKNYNYNLKNLCSRYSLDLLKIQSKYCKKIFNKSFFMSLNQSLIYFNDFNKFSNLSEYLDSSNIFLFSWNGFFLNNKYLKKIHNYYIFYNNNFKLFIYLIFININRLKLLLFSLVFKFINIFYLMYQHNLKK